eukprot:4793038-Pleurochrysis_carterae.AAC.5
MGSRGHKYMSDSCAINSAGKLVLLCSCFYSAFSFDGTQEEQRVAFAAEIRLLKCVVCISSTAWPLICMDIVLTCGHGTADT